VKAFTYDNIDRLTGMTNGVSSESYTFDGVGNRTASHKSTSYSYQPFNKIASTQTATYKSDANGNMTSKSEGSNFWRYTWDYENRLTQASTRKQTMRYRYDALGRRVRRHTNGRLHTTHIFSGRFSFFPVFTAKIVFDHDPSTDSKRARGLSRSLCSRFSYPPARSFSSVSASFASVASAQQGPARAGVRTNR
jgi:YD repeat-containing protein